MRKARQATPDRAPDRAPGLGRPERDVTPIGRRIVRNGTCRGKPKGAYDHSVALVS